MFTLMGHGIGTDIIIVKPGLICIFRVWKLGTPKFWNLKLLLKLKVKACNKNA